MSDITSTERAKFAWDKVLNAFKWIVVSGVATYGLNLLLNLLTDLNLSDSLVLVCNAIINVLIFAIAKYSEGQEKK